MGVAPAAAQSGGIAAVFAVKRQSKGLDVGQGDHHPNRARRILRTAAFVGLVDGAAVKDQHLIGNHAESARSSDRYDGINAHPCLEPPGPLADIVGQFGSGPDADSRLIYDVPQIERTFLRAAIHPDVSLLLNGWHRGQGHGRLAGTRSFVPQERHTVGGDLKGMPCAGRQRPSGPDIAQDVRPVRLQSQFVHPDLDRRLGLAIAVEDADPACSPFVATLRRVPHVDLAVPMHKLADDGVLVAGQDVRMGEQAQ